MIIDDSEDDFDDWMEQNVIELAAANGNYSQVKKLNKLKTSHVYFLAFYNLKRR